MKNGRTDIPLPAGRDNRVLSDANGGPDIKKKNPDFRIFTDIGGFIDERRNKSAE